MWPAKPKEFPTHALYDVTPKRSKLSVIKVTGKKVAKWILDENREESLNFYQIASVSNARLKEIV